VAALARHAGEPAPDLWRAQLLMELEDDAAAEDLLRTLVSRRPGDPAPRALLAQVLYEVGRDAEAAPVYAAARAAAAQDTAAVLWRQVRGIASPRERGTWERTAPAGRAAFLGMFWASRDPDLRTPLNERLGEHFRRTHAARRLFALLHPNSLFHHSRLWRVLAGGSGSPPAPWYDSLAGRVRHESAGGNRPAPGADVAPEESDETPNLEDGLDDRGRIFVRHGPPDERSVWNLDAETWRYHLPEGVFQVSFVRRTGGGWGLSGDAVITPIAAGEAVAAARLLATDRAAAPTLEFGLWSAAFRGGPPHRTDLLLFPDSVHGTAVLLDGAGAEIDRDSATGRVLHLAAPPGRYLLAVDGARDDRLGRFRSAATLPDFGGGSLSVSGLLVAVEPTPPRRPEMERAAPPRLALPGRRPVRFYAEVYGLVPRDGVTRYDVEYAVERVGAGGLLLGGPRRSSFRFRREQPARAVTVETLVVDPGRLPRGRYRLRLILTDATSGARSASAPLEFTLQ
jgi:hypothetical protein